MKKTTFSGKVAIVTGASAGLGRALALELAKQSASLVIAARRADRLEQVAEDCRRSGAQALAFPADVSDEAQCECLVAKAVDTFGRLDLLINNAGLAASALFEEFHDLYLFKHTMEVNFYGAVHCTYHALPHLIQSRGRIVAISSLGGKAAIPYNTPYISSKYALQGFCDALRMELVPHGVSVTVVCPSWVATEFHESQMDRDGKPRGAKGRAYYTKNTMTAEHCAQTTLRAAARRRREVLMSPGPLAAWLKLIAPGILDWFAVKVFLGSAARRAKSKLEKASS